MPEFILKNYQELGHDRIEKCPPNCQEKILLSAFRTNQKDLYFEKRAIKKHLE